MALPIGARLGPYEILGHLGSGGMGEVYRAHDSRLDRDVAVKILPDVVAEDETRRARFSQEARTAGSLNHPGIVAVYDLGVSDGVFYIASELVQGSTLRTMLSEGPLPARKAAALAVQIAEALAAAHAAGITHRDLKPENIMVTHDGRAKILDFGLARHTVAPSGEEASTLTQAITQEGAVMGTMGYMAPEQLRGKPADARSDIFSFGVVLYEMLTSRNAFRRDTGADSISAILREDPPELDATTPPAISQIVFRCIEKEPSKRFQSAADLAFSLNSFSDAPQKKARPRPVNRAWIPWAIAAAAVMLIPVAWWLKPDPDPLVYRITPATSYPGQAMSPALSPDGKQMAFTWQGEPAGAVGIYVKLLSGGSQPLRVSPGDRPSYYPSWSPDGSRIAYVRTEGNDTGIFVAPAMGGPERRIGHYAGDSFGGTAWSPDGKWIAASMEMDSGRSLGLVSVENGEIRRITTAPGTGTDVCPKFSPDGKALAFVRVMSNFGAQLEWLSLRGDGTAAGDPRRIGARTWNTHSVDWLPDGKSVVVPAIEGAIVRYWKLPLRGDRAVLLPLQLPRTTTFVEAPEIAVHGSRMVTVSATYLARFDRLSWNEASRQWQPAVFYNSSGAEAEPEFSVDGKWLAFRSSRSGLWEIWRGKPDGSEALPISSSEGERLGDPRWSPNGHSVVFSMPHEGFSRLYMAGSEGGPMSRITNGPGNEARPSFSADGKWIYFRSDRGGSHEIWKMPSSGGPAQQVTHHGAHEPFESSDGRWLYFIKRAGGREVYRVPISGNGEEELVVTEPGLRAWAVGGGNLYLGVGWSGEATRIERFNPVTHQKEEVYRFPARYEFLSATQHSLSVSRDERSMIANFATPVTVDILLVENFR